MADFFPANDVAVALAQVWLPAIPMEFPEDGLDASEAPSPVDRFPVVGEYRHVKRHRVVCFHNFLCFLFALCAI
jgi:hypothetical protein